MVKLGTEQNTTITEFEVDPKSRTVFLMS